MNNNLPAFYEHIVRPALNILQSLTGPATSPEAAHLLLAIARQEGGQKLSRVQVIAGGRPGPARGVWQFEKAGGVRGVMTHPASTKLARAVTYHFSVPWDAKAIWTGLAEIDELAAMFARLLLLTDPTPLPTTQQAGWACYQRNWRPGKPHPDAWPANWAAAAAAMALEPR